MSPQTIHVIQLVTVQDVGNGFMLANMIWPTQFVGRYTVSASFCYRSTNPAIPPDTDSRRNTVVDAGIRDVATTGYQHVLNFNPDSPPAVNDVIDFWGLGQQLPSPPVLTVEVT
jgi:hypothetical protein